MNFARLKCLGCSCWYFLLIAISATVNAADVAYEDSGIAVEGWSADGARDIPILSFDQLQPIDKFFDDIRAEGMVQDRDGSVRFQLSHSGPLSRQVFANVRKVEQDNGLTRSIITNIADGSQMEYLTHTPRELPDRKFDKRGDGNLLIQMADMEDQNIECPLCVYFGGWILVELTCSKTASLAHEQCRIDCRRSGGIKSFDTGICGSVYSECICQYPPKQIEEVFSGG